MRFTDAEWKIMNAVWDRPESTARDIWEALRADTGWEYSTVRTMLGRLAEKGALRAIEARYASVYEPLVRREEALDAEVSSLAERAFGGSLAPLVNFLLGRGKLSDADRQALRSLIAESERGEQGGDGHADRR